MGFFKKVGKFFGKVGRGIGKTVRGATRVIAASGIPVVSSVAGVASGVIDTIAPGRKEKMVEAVQRDSEIKVHEVEQTLANQGVSPVQIPTLTRAAVNELQATTGAPVNDSVSVTKMGFMDKVNHFFSKPVSWVIMAIACIGGFILLRPTDTKRRYR